MTTGEAEINAAATSKLPSGLRSRRIVKLTFGVLQVMALTLSTTFDLTQSYFLVAGIAGINPYHGTLGTAAFARFSVQVSSPKLNFAGLSVSAADAPILTGRTRV